MAEIIDIFSKQPNHKRVVNIPIKRRKLKTRKQIQNQIQAYHKSIPNNEINSILGLENDPFPLVAKVKQLPDADWFQKGMTKVSKDEISRRQKMIDVWRKDPFAFLKHQMGRNTSIWRRDCPPAIWEKREKRLGKPLPLWSKQREIFKAMIKHRKVAVKSGHAVGKTYIAADIVLYFLYVWGCIVVTTAPTHRQVEDVLWREIRKHYFEAEAWRAANGKTSLGGRILKTSLELGEKWYATGFSTDQPGFNMPGTHEENILFLVDEACGVKNEVYDTSEAILTSANSWVLLIGNPVDPANEFYKCFKPGSGYHPITISCYDSPNVKNNKIIYPQLVEPSWPDRMKKKWGKGSPLFMARVEGDFPDASVDKLISLKHILQSLERETEPSRTVSIGVDVARHGTDRTVILSREENGRVVIHQVYQGQRTTETAGRAMVLCDRLTTERKNKDGSVTVLRPVINVDDIGVGGGVTDAILDAGYPCNGINVSEAPDETADELGKVCFRNKRAQYYWKLKEAFESGLITLVNDDMGWAEEMADELCQTPVLHKGGKIQIPDKEVIKKLLGRSPDLADALMLAEAESSAESARDLVRWL